MLSGAFQLQKLRDLIAVLVPHNRFYTRKLRDVKFETLREFSARVPFTLKHELVADQRQHPPFGSNHTYPLERYTRFSQTSGTSGEPLRWLDTAESWTWMIGNWKRVFEAAGLGIGDRIFFAFSFGPFLGFWVAFDCASRLGYMAIPGGGMGSAARLRTLIDTSATVLCCTPTYAIRLAETAAKEQIDLTTAAIKTVILAGEPGGSIPGTRQQIAQLWDGASIVDHHGMTETGPVSYGCPAHPCVLHVIESSYYAEVIDPTAGHAVPPGASGELVLTNLGRLGSPLLRYRTGDLVKRGADSICACGSADLTLDGGILARADDMVVIRGVNVYPSALEDLLRKCGVSEYEVTLRTVHGMHEMSIQVECGTGDVELPRRVEAALRTALSLRIDVGLVEPGTLPRHEMKAKRWLRQ